MSFLVPNPLPPAAEAGLAAACLASTGDDQTPVPTEVRFESAKHQLTLVKAPNESGDLLIPWPMGPFGTVVVASSTLLERDQPYRLLVELARGKLNQVRKQTAEWQAIGLRTGPDFDRALADVTRSFSRAVMATNPVDADQHAARILEQAHGLADRLVRDYVEQMMATRRRQGGLLNTRLAARFTRAPTGELADEYAHAFTAAAVALRWCDIEPNEGQFDWSEPDEAVSAALAAGLPVTLGPVIDLAPGMVPGWATVWTGDLPALAAFMCDFLETALHRYKSDVRRWVICAGFNHADALGLVDDDRLRLAYRLFEAAAHIDPTLELVLSVAQPWGDYLGSEEQTISPLTFPDDLVRAGVRLAGIDLEIRSGTAPRGSRPRDLLDTARILDLFDLLGLPLEVTFSRPSHDWPDPRAIHSEVLWRPGWLSPPSPEGQAEWGASCAKLALCWPNVRAVTWDHWSDDTPHLVPAGGLVADGQPKPLLAQLRALRTSYLMP